MMRLLYYYDGACDANEMRHAQEVVNELGIKYARSWGESMYNGFVFTGLDMTTVPEVLPDWIELKNDRCMKGAQNCAVDTPEKYRNPDQCPDCAPS